MKVYDNYEISPCKRYEEPDSPGKFYFEVCEPNEADVWTLYGHINGEGVQAIGDFATAPCPLVQKPQAISSNFLLHMVLATLTHLC